MNSIKLPEHIVAEELEVAVVSVDEVPETNGGAYFYNLADGRRALVQFSDYERFRLRGIRCDVDPANPSVPRVSADGYFFIQKNTGALVAYISRTALDEMLLKAPLRTDKRSQVPYKSLPVSP